MNPEDILFRADTPAGFRVRTTRRYWDFLSTTKRAVMAGRENDVMKALGEPDEVRRSISNPDAFLFYRAESPSCWLCVVAKRLDGEGFVITAYPTDAIKRGELVWKK